MLESISFDMPRPTGWPAALSFGAPCRRLLPGVEADPRLLQVAPAVLHRIGRIVVREAVELLRLRVVGALPRDPRHRPELLADLLHEVGDGNDLLLERRRRRDEPEQVVTALCRDLRCPCAVEQGVVDVVDLDLDVVRLAPALDVGVVEPLVVGGDEVGPLHDPELSRELPVRVLERAVEPEGSVGEAAEHADGEGGGGSSLEQVTSGQFRARVHELVGCVCHRFLLSARFSSGMLPL